MLLELLLDTQELLISGWRELLELLDFVGRSNACDHIFPLGVHKELAVKPVFAGGRIACECDTCARVFTHVAEHHGHHGDGSSPVAWDLLHRAIGDSAVVVPGAEDGPNRGPELVCRLFRKSLTCAPKDNALERFDDEL